jgi:hypothetical protein
VNSNSIGGGHGFLDNTKSKPLVRGGHNTTEYGSTFLISIFWVTHMLVARIGNIPSNKLAGVELVIYLCCTSGDE